MPRGRVPPGGKAPFCADCGGADCHVVNRQGGGSIWLCGSCEFLRANPAAELRQNPAGLPINWPVRKKNQKESLF